MNKQLIWKFALILGLVLVCALEIFPLDKKLKPGIDIAGGTSLIYEIDDSDMSSIEKRELAQTMIRILRQRIDPANKTNMVWRAHGTNQIEIQMPQASAETEGLREEYMQRLDELEAFNLDERVIRQSLDWPEQLDVAAYQEKRRQAFEELSDNAPERMELLNALAQTHDVLQSGQEQRDTVLNAVADLQGELATANISEITLQGLVTQWDAIDEPNQALRLTQLGIGEENHTLARQFIQARKELAQVRQTLTGAAGQDAALNAAWVQVKEENIRTDRIEKILAASPVNRQQELTLLKELHPERAPVIDALAQAYDAYAIVDRPLDDVDDLKRKLQGAGVLEFRILPKAVENVLTVSEMQDYTERLRLNGPAPRPEDRFVWLETRDPLDFQETVLAEKKILAEFAGSTYVLASNLETERMLNEPGADTWRLTHAGQTSDQLGRPAVSFALNERGGVMFLALTRANLQRPLCIILDGIAYTSPNLESAISTQGRITGRFTQTETRDLADTLNAGSLPARLGDQPIREHTVGPSIGEENLRAGQKAGTIGLIAVAVFMVAYYLVPGFLAGIALFLNLLFILGVMALSEATFTLPGIAGLILTIGMAVDANVLIFERIREEQARGSSLKMAIRNGYNRALRTIMDANITTFIVAMILYLVASEEVKGFAVTLMIGIVSSMFTALFVTRAVFDLLTGKKILKDKLRMMQIVRNPQVNWLGMRPIFWGVSAVLVLSSWIVFLSADSKYSIEFTGGTSVYVDLDASGADWNRTRIEEEIRAAGTALESERPNDIGSARVQRIGDPANRQFEIMTTESNRVVVTLRAKPGKSMTTSEIEKAVKAQARAQGNRRLNDVVVNESGEDFVLVTSESNARRAEVLIQTALPDMNVVQIEAENLVNDVVRDVLGSMLSVQDDLQPTNIYHEAIDAELVAANPSYGLGRFLGGVLIRCEFGGGGDDTLGRLRDRFDQSTTRGDMEQYADNDFQVFAPGNVETEDGARVTGVEFAVASPDITGPESPGWDAFVAGETDRVTRALEWTTSLSRVTQIHPSVGREAMMSALSAIVLSLLAIVIYIWIRFGTVRFGMAAVAALLHDVSIAMGLVAASAWLSSTTIGQLFLIQDFKIDLPMIAGFLTVIGYSLNDTIVVFDRIRENRGKQPILTKETINMSINQTLSRTILTSVTTLLVLVIMYAFGGAGLRGFNYVLIIGVLVGTYSSIGIAAPLLVGTQTEAARKKQPGKGLQGNLVKA